MRSENSRFFLTDKIDYINMDRSDFERAIRGEKPIKKYEPRLPRETVLAIYKSKDTPSNLAKVYQVDAKVISKIKRKINYRRYLEGIE